MILKINPFFFLFLSYFSVQCSNVTENLFKTAYAGQNKGEIFLFNYLDMISIL